MPVIILTKFSIASDLRQQYGDLAILRLQSKIAEMKNSILITIMVAALFAGIYPAQVKAQTEKQTKKTSDTAKRGSYHFDDGHNFDRAYVDRVLNTKTRLLQQYLTALVEKKEGAKKTIDNAMLLFNNDESRLVTVTNSVTGKVYTKPVREYLSDVAKLPYKSVKITYRNYTAIENLRRQPDGLYKGVVVFEQEFSGYDKEGKALYHDVVTRNAEVTVRLAIYPKDQNKHIVALDIFFGNMGVTEMQ